MRIFLVNPRYDLSPAGTVKRRLHFVAIVIRIIHFYDWLHLAVRLHQFTDVGLLLLQLLLVRDSLIIASAAFLGVWTASVGGFSAY